ncbi:MAG: hypothetical protein LIO59_07310 [Oscillospiraceae bacterium]|nr:hypothetical protein [Oscillospiraceae bacterium]
MANKIQIRRGLEADLPTLSAGKPAFTTDSQNFYVGTGDGNVNMGGSQWYSGTAMSGTSTTTGAYSYSAASAKVGDYYLNTTYGYVYRCTTAGEGTAAKWTYQGSIRGATGATGSYATVDSALSSTSTNPVQNKAVYSALDDKLDANNFMSNGFVGIDEVTEGVLERTRAATIVVAASDSVSKYGVDYRCTGTSDDTVIQSAIDALPDTGGKIVLLEGTYNISTALTCDKDVVFEGMGEGTFFDVLSTGFMSFTGDSNAVFRDMSFSSTTISMGLFRRSSGDVDLLLDNLHISVTASGHGAIVYGGSPDYTKVHLHKVKIDGVYLDNSSDCTSAFNECMIKGGEGCYINLTCTSSSNGTEIFYCCRGCFSNGTLKSEMYISGWSEAMSFTDSYIYCNSVTGASPSTAFLGHLSNNKIIANSTCYCNFSSITGNEIKQTGSGQLWLYARTVSGNVIENYVSGDVSFADYSSVTGNVSKYTMTSSTPTGATIENNVVYSSLSISSSEV